VTFFAVPLTCSRSIQDSLIYFLNNVAQRQPFLNELPRVVFRRGTVAEKPAFPRDDPGQREKMLLSTVALREDAVTVPVTAVSSSRSGKERRFRFAR
jgi:hypothetical protein